MTKASVDATNLDVALGVAADRATRTGETACVWRSTVGWSVAGTGPPFVGMELVADVEPDGCVERYDRPNTTGGTGA